MKPDYKEEITMDCDNPLRKSDISSQHRELLDIIAEIIAIDVIKKMQKEMKEKTNV